MQIVEMTFHHQMGPGNRKHQLIKVLVKQKLRQDGSDVLLWVKQEKESKVVMCEQGFHVQHTQRNSLLRWMAAVLYPSLETIPSPQHSRGNENSRKWQTGRKIVSVETRRVSR